MRLWQVWIEIFVHALDHLSARLQNVFLHVWSDSFFKSFMFASTLLRWRVNIRHGRHFKLGDHMINLWHDKIGSRVLRTLHQFRAVIRNTQRGTFYLRILPFPRVEFALGTPVNWGRSKSISQMAVLGLRLFKLRLLRLFKLRLFKVHRPNGSAWLPLPGRGNFHEIIENCWMFSVCRKSSSGLNH